MSLNPFEKFKTNRFIKVQKLIKKSKNEIVGNNFEVAEDLIYQVLIETINIKIGIISDNLPADSDN
ncbi:MAG: hypothetical protein LBS81_01590 [Endomicrobium sp.]|jgi:hypothetical protein|nr:hypothetical protein [Endomicrobium sp.]